MFEATIDIVIVDIVVVVVFVDDVDVNVVIVALFVDTGHIIRDFHNDFVMGGGVPAPQYYNAIYL